METNGNNCLVSLPVLGLAIWLVPQPGAGGNVFLSSFLGTLVFWVLLTNQFHKWAHLPAPPPFLAFLQRCNLILPPTIPEADAGFVIMEQVEYPPMSGTNTICVVTVLLETGIIPIGGRSLC